MGLVCIERCRGFPAPLSVVSMAQQPKGAGAFPPPEGCSIERAEDRGRGKV